MLPPRPLSDRPLKRRSASRWWRWWRQRPGATCGAAVGLALVYGSLGLPAFSDPNAPVHTHVVRRYLNDTMKETGVPNAVTSVLASYRGYDTLGETTVVFTAGAGVIALLRRRPRLRGEDGT